MVGALVVALGRGASFQSWPQLLSLVATDALNRVDSSARSWRRPSVVAALNRGYAPGSGSSSIVAAAFWL